MWTRCKRLALALGLMALVVLVPDASAWATTTGVCAGSSSFGRATYDVQSYVLPDGSKDPVPPRPPPPAPGFSTTWYYVATAAGQTSPCDLWESTSFTDDTGYSQQQSFVLTGAVVWRMVQPYTDPSLPPPPAGLTPSGSSAPVTASPSPPPPAASPTASPSPSAVSPSSSAAPSSSPPASSCAAPSGVSCVQVTSVDPALLGSVGVGLVCLVLTSTASLIAQLRR